MIAFVTAFIKCVIVVWKMMHISEEIQNHIILFEVMIYA